MEATNQKIIVSVDLEQKNEMVINGVTMSTATLFEKNYREKSPTIATVISGNEYVKEGDVLICHHNLFYLPSPYHLYDNLFTIPFSKILFAIIKEDGEIEPICGNLICNKIKESSLLELPPELQKFHINRYEVEKQGWTDYKKGDIIFTRPQSGYDIVYNINGEEKRITKVDSEMICGVLKNLKVA